MNPTDSTDLTYSSDSTDTAGSNFSLSDFVGTLGSAYGSYVQGRNLSNLSQAQLDAQRAQTQLQAQVAANNALNSNNQSANFKTIALYALLGIIAIFAFKAFSK